MDVKFLTRTSCPAAVKRTSFKRDNESPRDTADASSFSSMTLAIAHSPSLWIWRDMMLPPKPIGESNENAPCTEITQHYLDQCNLFFFEFFSISIIVSGKIGWRSVTEILLSAFIGSEAHAQRPIIQSKWTRKYSDVTFPFSPEHSIFSHSTNFRRKQKLIKTHSSQ